MRFGYFSFLSRRRVAQALLAYFLVAGSVVVFNPCFADQSAAPACPHCVGTEATQSCDALVKLNCDLPQSISAPHYQSALPDLHTFAPLMLLTFAILFARVVIRTHRVSISPSLFPRSPPLYLRFGVLLI